MFPLVSAIWVFSFGCLDRGSSMFPTGWFDVPMGSLAVPTGVSWCSLRVLVVPQGVWVSSLGYLGVHVWMLVFGCCQKGYPDEPIRVSGCSHMAFPQQCQLDVWMFSQGCLGVSVLSGCFHVGMYVFPWRSGRRGWWMFSQVCLGVSTRVSGYLCLNVPVRVAIFPECW